MRNISVDPTADDSSPIIKSRIYGISSVEAIPNFSSIYTSESLHKKTASLLDELSKFGFSTDMPADEDTSHTNGIMELSTMPSYADYPSLMYNLIRDIGFILPPDIYFLRGKLQFNNQTIATFIGADHYFSPPHSLTLIIKDKLDLEGILLIESLPNNPHSVGFEYSLKSEPLARQALSLIANRTISNKHFSGSPNKRSIVTGYEGSDGLRASILLNLQEKNHETYLKCYEVELQRSVPFEEFSQLDAYITSVVPQSIWQPEQHHFCMIAGDGSFPLLPLDLNRVTELLFVAHYNGDSPKTLVELLKGLPLSADGKNPWYANGTLGNGNLNLLFNPLWKNHNIALVYRERSSNEFSAEQIYNVVQGINNIKLELLHL